MDSSKTSLKSKLVKRLNYLDKLIKFYEAYLKIKQDIRNPSVQDKDKIKFVKETIKKHMKDKATITERLIFIYSTKRKQK